MGVLPFLVLATSVSGGTATFSKPLLSMPPQQVATAHQKLLKEPPANEIGLQAHKISYFSPNSPAGHRRLSGALFLPDGIKPRGVVLYTHGTIASRDGVGSRVPAHSIGWALPYVANGFAVVMPDYIGLGDSKSIHPYLLGRINALSSLDMVRPAMEVAPSLGRNLDGLPIFLAGYSEGGGIAMWTARVAQEMPQLGVKFTATAPQSGPYDLSDVSIKSAISTQSNPLYRAVRKMLVAYVGYSADYWIPGVDLRDLFVPSFATYVPRVFQTSKSDDEVLKRLVAKANQIRPGSPSVRGVLTPEIQRAIDRRDLRHPLMKVLAQNDCYNWSPEVPMRLYAIERDFVVDHKNTLKTVNAMRKRGLGEDMVSYEILKDGDLNHVTAEAPIAKRAAEWFLTFL